MKLSGDHLAGSQLTVSLGGRGVLDGVDFIAEPGTITGLVGPNGAGKSTLLRTLAGLIAPDQGSVTIGGVELGQLARAELARRLAYLPQERIVHWQLPVREVVGLGRLPHRTFAASETARDRTTVETAMRAVEVEALAGRVVTQLSGGELARVLLARALAQEPRVLLADEPAAGLDPAHQIKLFEHLAALARAGATLVIALHDLSLAARYCGRIQVLKEGRSLAAGVPDAVLTPALLKAAYGVTAHVGRIEGVPVVLPLGLSGA